MATSAPPRDAGTRRFHSAVWRWHFYAGICVLPLALLLALSGLAMLAGEPLDRALRNDLHTVTPRAEVRPAAEQAAAVAAAFPEFDLKTLRVAASPTESTRIDLAPRHTAAGHGEHGAAEAPSVFVDPYTARVLGTLDANATIYAWAKRLHGTLLLGRVGDYVIEVGAGFGVLLVATGLYLWWPRQGRTLRAALLPSLAAPGRRRWRDLHGAAAAWITPFVLFFFVSGLAWTPFWGGELVQTWSSLPGERFTAPLSADTHATLNHGAHREVPWAVERTPLPAASAAHDPHHNETRGLDIDAVVSIARANGLSSFRVHWPRGAEGVWTIASTTIAGDTQELGGDRILHVDPTTGAIRGEVRFADYSPLGQFMAASIPLHQGDTGLANLVVNALLALAVIGMSGAAMAAWWARRPRGTWRLVPPPMPRDTRTWRGAVALMLGASLAFPLAAATIATVLVVDLAIFSRIRACESLFE